MCKIKEKEEKCDCCDGKGLVSGETIDDLSSCFNCNGTGILKYKVNKK